MYTENLYFVYILVLQEYLSFVGFIQNIQKSPDFYAGDFFDIFF